MINWPDIVNSDSVTIVIPPCTIRELNSHKDAGTKRRIRERAGMVIKKLLSYFRKNFDFRLSDSVMLRLEPIDPSNDIFEENFLRREIQDDHLIASMVMAKEQAYDTEIVLISSDFGLNLLAKARKNNISSIILPDDLKLVEEPDPDQELINRQAKEISELKSSAPKLALIFTDNTQKMKFSLPKPEELNLELFEDKINKVKAMYPKMDEPPDEAKLIIDSGYPSITDIKSTHRDIISQVLNNPSIEDIRKYNDRIEKFYCEFSEYLHQDLSYRNEKSRTFPLEIWLSNTGTKPAEDVDVFLHFPDGFQLFNPDDLPEPPEVPDPPKSPKSLMESLSFPKISSYLTSIPLISKMGYEPPTSAPNVSIPTIRRTHSYDVEINIGRIKHLLREEIGVMYVVFDSYDSANSFHIDYDLVAGNIAKKSSGKLHVIINKE